MKLGSDRRPRARCRSRRGPRRRPGPRTWPALPRGNAAQAAGQADPAPLQHGVVDHQLETPASARRAMIRSPSSTRPIGPPSWPPGATCADAEAARRRRRSARRSAGARLRPGLRPRSPRWPRASRACRGRPWGPRSGSPAPRRPCKAPALDRSNRPPRRRTPARARGERRCEAMPATLTMAPSGASVAAQDRQPALGA